MSTKREHFIRIRDPLSPHRILLRYDPVRHVAEVKPKSGPAREVSLPPQVPGKDTAQEKPDTL